MRTLARLLLGGEDRVAILLLFAAMLCLTWGIGDQKWVGDTGILMVVALVAALTGFLLARWRVNRVLALLFGVAVGPALAFVSVANLIPPIWLWDRGPELLTFWGERLTTF